MTTAVQLFHSLPPIASLPTATVPAAKSSAGARNQPASLHVVCASRKGRDDDYHATLKALNSKGRFPRKSLGQHYMLNPEINEQLARAANVEEGDVVLEIGPGTGSLTNVLINSGATVLAIEKDPHMVDLVRERFETTDKFKVLQEDFVKCHIRSHISPILENRKALNVSLIRAKEETAVRLVELSLRTSEYRPINIFVNFYSEPEYNFRVPRTNFFPQPNVDAAVVTFRLKQAPDYPSVASTKSFFSMVHSAFNGKRKMLRRSLQHICPSNEIERALGDAGLPTTSRPEELTLDDFVKLYNMIAKV
ncbi:hypothetical protein E1A91_A11G093900v1 [Gossypium mustelinum]|uniref:rRNA adenine N(6)-methyltransferase n=4 Tax=Gossypium TaxID=3633 RepID=A0A5J5TNE8_GOSBA|nr:hypothetical protein ES319_A11G091400v1 [Gossypium barbadense]TYG93270.1 hypothetical protein ES288_A11G097300v1 [Gossypium darwinii]TYH99887.1 hypothetical protein ES332_A11G096500v1 [Gossypium tomentosum]TYJ08732.1 hypothetical protein E1A91_A11G093900v1 [Gossypium mustelinum]